jgi:2-keto-3-deoxy-L-rhamnonate aldolase RhmA
MKGDWMRVAAAARAHGKAAAFMPADRAWVDRVQALGNTMLGVGTDHGLLGSAVEQMVAGVMAVDGKFSSNNQQESNRGEQQ